jgi:hypothetical protein
MDIGKSVPHWAEGTNNIKEDKKYVLREWDLMKKLEFLVYISVDDSSLECLCF